MALPPADRRLDLCLISSQYPFPLEGSIDLSSIPGMISPISVEEEDINDSYIQDIPGVRSLGIKRHCLKLSHTAPSKLQRISSVATNNDLLQVTKTLKFSTAENPVAPLVKGEVETCGRDVERSRPALMALSNLSDRGRIEKEQKLKGLAKDGDHVQFYKEYLEEVRGHIEENKAMKEKTVEKDGEITKLRKELTDVNTEKDGEITKLRKEFTDVNTEKDGEITKLTKEFTDVKTQKETLIKQHSKVIEELGTIFRIEKAALEGGKKELRDLLTEKSGLLSQRSREIEDWKTRYSTAKSNVLAAFPNEETQNFSSNDETCGQSVQK